MSELQARCDLLHQLTEQTLPIKLWHEAQRWYIHALTYANAHPELGMRIACWAGREAWGYQITRLSSSDRTLWARRLVAGELEGPEVRFERRGYSWRMVGGGGAVQLGQGPHPSRSKLLTKGPP